MTMMFSCRACFALAAGWASLLVAAPAFADSLPSGWTDDDAPPEVQRPAPAQNPPEQRQVSRARPASPNLDNEPQQQPDPSADLPDDAAPSPTAPEAGSSDTDPSALSAFNGALAGHGTWVDDPDYGRIWVPNSDEVGEGFAPYQTAGHWSLDDQSEWLWVSDYSWGYVPFHYGRWLWVPARGWSWIPGRVYAPAWVSWRVGPGGYIGWAPRAPGYYWWRGGAVGFWHRPVAAYCFAPTGRVFARDLGSVVVRTPAGVRAAAAGTRAYQGASPTRVGAHARMSPTPEQAHVSAGAAAAAHAHADARAAAFSHGGSAGHASAHWNGAYGHSNAGGSSAHAYGHTFNSGASSTPSASHSSSSSTSSNTHNSSSSARSSGHASGHHR